MIYRHVPESDYSVLCGKIRFYEGRHVTFTFRLLSSSSDLAARNSASTLTSTPRHMAQTAFNSAPIVLPVLPVVEASPYAGGAAVAPDDQTLCFLLFDGLRPRCRRACVSTNAGI